MAAAAFLGRMSEDSMSDSEDGDLFNADADPVVPHRGPNTAEAAVEGDLEWNDIGSADDFPDGSSM